MNLAIIPHKNIRLSHNMQTFGKFSTNIEIEYLSEHYIYTPKDDETITTKELEAMLKKRRKTIAGTIFLYNPTLSPVGYNNDTTLAKQGYEFNGEYCELNMNAHAYLFASALKDAYKGKLVEIKYLFNLNKANIEPTPILEEFDADLDRYTSTQLTRYDKYLNYQDVANIRLSGKFVFFASGHKYDRHHKAIIAYARGLAAQVKKLGKEIAFLHDNNYDKEECIDVAYFLSPIASGKAKDKRANGFKNAFRTNPPTIQKLS